jgi:hypothetical protein
VKTLPFGGTPSLASKKTKFAAGMSPAAQATLDLLD